MIEVMFFIAAGVAVAGAVMTVTRLNAVHALLYMVVTVLAIALVFYLLGAAFIAALQVIIYAGAVMVLFVFVTMMLHQGQKTIDSESRLFQPRRSLGAAFLCLILLLELLYLLGPLSIPDQHYPVGVRRLGMQLYGPYLLLVEISALLLLSALVGAFHIGHSKEEVQ